MSKIIITKYVRYITVQTTSLNRDFFYLFLKELHTYTQVYDYKTRRVITKLDKRWYVYDYINKTYRFPISLYDKLYKYIMLRTSKDRVKIINKHKHKFKKIDIPFNNNIKPYDYQLPYIDYLVNAGIPNRLTEIQMGKGKTVIGSKAISDIGNRCAIIIQPKYIDKWIGDINGLLDLEEDELIVIKGGDSLRKLIASAKDSTLKAKVIIISNKTVQFFISNHIKNKKDIYGCKPDTLMELLNIGVILTDEVHEHFHITYTMMLYFNSEIFIGLTATLVNNNVNLERMYSLLFPLDGRIDGLETDKYINTYEIGYKINNMVGVESEGIMGYSSAKFEQSLMGNYTLLNNYLKMIHHYYLEGYEYHRQDGDKSIIYCYTVNMCTLVSDYIRSKTNLKVARYVSEDDYSVIEESDVIVSTVLSGGTGLDIKGLITVMLTISVDSIQINRQVPGRLRYIENKDLRYYFLYSTSIYKHINYTTRRRKVVKLLSSKYNIGNYIGGI